MQIEISFHWTFSEFRQLNNTFARAAQKYPRRHKSPLFSSAKVEHRLLMLSMAIVTVIAFGGVETWFGPSILTFAVGSFLFLPLVWLYYNYIQAQLRIRDAWTNNANWQQAQQYKISDQGIVQSLPGVRVETDWSSFTFSYEDSAYCFLFRSPQAATIIPKRSFPSRKELDEFRQKCGEIGKAAGFPVQV